MIAVIPLGKLEKTKHGSLGEHSPFEAHGSQVLQPKNSANTPPPVPPSNARQKIAEKRSRTQVAIKLGTFIPSVHPIMISSCLFCHSTNIKKFGIRHNKDGDIQKFYCNDCQKHFSYNIGFENMKHNPQAVTTALQLYFSGESLRHTKDSLKLLGVYVSHQTIHNWIQKYTDLMKQYVDKLKPNVGSTWRADEVFIKFSGNMKYLFALMDDETRYWIAQEVANTKEKHDAKGLLHEAKVIAGKRPNAFITDGLPSYHDAFNKEFYTNKRPQSKHINAIKLDGDMNNNKQERLNGEIRR